MMEVQRYVLVVAAVAGTMTTAGLTWYAQNQSYDLFDPLLSYIIPLVVFFSMGAVPVLLLAQYRTVTPSLVCAGTLWIWVRAEADRGPADPLVGFLFFAGPASILLSFGVAWIEYRLQPKVLEIT